MLIGAADLFIMFLILEGEEALFDEEFTEEEVLGELAPLTVLLAFLLIKGNRCVTEEKTIHPLLAEAPSMPFWIHTSCPGCTTAI